MSQEARNNIVATAVAQAINEEQQEAAAIARISDMEAKINFLSVKVHEQLVGQESAVAIAAIMGVMRQIVKGSNQEFVATTVKYLRDEANDIELLARTPAIIKPGDKN